MKLIPYNTILKSIQPMNEMDLSKICAGLGDEMEARRWAEAAAENQLHIVCAWCGEVLQEGESRNPLNTSHGICKPCLKKEEEAA